MTLANKLGGQGERGEGGGWKKELVYFVGLEERDGRIKWILGARREGERRERSWRKKETASRGSLSCRCYTSVYMEGDWPSDERWRIRRTRGEGRRGELLGSPS